TNDTCSGGTCGGTAVACTALDECHQAGTCAPATGMCSNPPSPVGTPCTGGACDGAGNCEATTTTTTTTTSSTTRTTTTSTTAAPTTTTTLASCLQSSSISASFNGIPISAGKTIWFNSVLKASEVGPSGATVRFDQSTIQFTAN